MNAKMQMLASSLADTAARCPVERLEKDSRYVIAADLRLGDGSKKDEAVKTGKTLYTILGDWYLPRDYTLVLNGDIEDLGNFWIKSITAAWPKMYALFDAFAVKGKLRKIIGERDLTLLKLYSYPYEILHGLRLDIDRGSILITHGHQASRPYIGREYFSDFLQKWIHSSRRQKSRDDDSDGQGRFKAERRLYRAAVKLGMILIEGHTHRPLFESITNRDAVRIELERLLREGDPRKGESTIDALIDYCRKEARSRAHSGLFPTSGPGIGMEGLGPPNLFCPGRAEGARGIRFLEIEGGCIRFVRWSRKESEIAPPSAQAGVNVSFSAVPSGCIEGTSYRRMVIRSASIDDIFDRVSSMPDSGAASAG
jgi:predicted phosphodiesterase